MPPPCEVRIDPKCLEDVLSRVVSGRYRRLIPRTLVSASRTARARERRKGTTDASAIHRAIEDSVCIVVRDAVQTWFSDRHELPPREFRARWYEPAYGNDRLHLAEYQRLEDDGIPMMPRGLFRILPVGDLRERFDFEIQLVPVPGTTGVACFVVYHIVSPERNR